MSFARYKALLEERTMGTETVKEQRDREALIEETHIRFCRYVDICGERGYPVYVIVGGSVRGLDAEITEEAEGFKIGRLKSTGHLWIGSDIPKSPFEAYDILSRVTRLCEPDDITGVE